MAKEWHLFTYNCPECGAFYSRYLLLEQCDCGHKFDRTENDIAKEQHNLSIAEEARQNGYPIEWYMLAALEQASIRRETNPDGFCAWAERDE